MCIFCLFCVSNLCEHQTKAVFDLKLLVGWGEHKVVLDESGFRAYCVDVNCGLNFLSVKSADRSMVMWRCGRKPGVAPGPIGGLLGTTKVVPKRRTGL